MRKSLLLLALLALALPAAGVGAIEYGEGTLSVESGRGKVTVDARGAVIGRLGSGSITIWDLTPEDANEPVVWGDDLPVRLVGETGVRYSGTGLRFRVIGGRYRIAIAGRAIDVSAVGKGWASLRGEGYDPRRVLGRRCGLLARSRASRFRSWSGASCSAASPSSETCFARHGLMAGNAQTILVVEDEASIASFVSLYLKNAGYDVRAVSTGSAALTQVAAETPALIILDLMLPDIDGIEICRASARPPTCRS